MITVKRFTAPWCGPCRAVGPILNDLAIELPTVAFEIVDVDTNPDIATSLGIKSIPCVIVYKDGTEKDRVIGAHPKSTYKTVITNWL